MKCSSRDCQAFRKMYGEVSLILWLMRKVRYGALVDQSGGRVYNIVAGISSKAERRCYFSHTSQNRIYSLFEGCSMFIQCLVSNHADTFVTSTGPFVKESVSSWQSSSRMALKTQWINAGGK